MAVPEQHQEASTQRQLQELAARVARLEDHLQLLADRGAAPPAASHRSTSAPRTDLADAPPTAPIADTGALVEKARTLHRLRGEGSRRGHQPLEAAPQATIGATRDWSSALSPATRADEPTSMGRVPPIIVPPPVIARARSLELAIGGKWMAWVGALTVVLAAGFAVMVGIERGWWGHLSAELRVIMIAGLGASLLLAGELAMRRIGKAASAGLLSAGLGTLYLDSFAAFQVFGLLGPNATLALLGAVSLLGFALTLRTRFLSIGMLSIVAGYAAPLMLQSRAGLSVYVPMYLTMLFGVALGLSAVHPRPFRALRYVALAGQLLVGFVWIVSDRSVSWQPAMVFMTIWAAMLLGEAVYAALRAQSAMGNVVASVIGTAAFVTAGCWILNAVQPAGFNWMGAFTLAVAALNAAAAAQFGPGIESLRQPPRSAIDKLALALWIQAGVLLVAAIALHFDGFGQSVVWLAVSLAAIELGRRLPSRGVAAFGLCVGVPALARVWLVDWWAVAALKGNVLVMGDVTLTRWSLLAVGSLAAVFLGAHRLRARPPAAWRIMPVVLASIGAALWLALCASASQGLVTTAAWLAGAAALLALERFGRRQRYFEIALMVLAAAALRWTTLDALASAESRAVFVNTQAVLNWQMALGGAIATVGVWAFQVARRRMTPMDGLLPARLPTTWIPVLACGMLLIGFSVEVQRALWHARPLPAWLNVWPDQQLQTLCWIGLWTIGGALMLQIGRLSRLESMMVSGLVILWVSAIAWLTIGTLFSPLMRASSGAWPVLNLQFGVGALALAMLVLSIWSLRAAPSTALTMASLAALRYISLGCIALLGLWLGSLEVQRSLGGDAMVRQAGLSVYWGVYGAALVVIGFARRAAIVRYAGLLLLLVTMAKVLIVDFTALDDLPRVISTLAAGLVLIATSALYVKLSPRLTASAP